MYTVAPIYRDKELVRAAALTALFTLITLALFAHVYLLAPRATYLYFVVALGMTPVIRTYAEETVLEFRGYRTRLAMAQQHRYRAAYHQNKSAAS